MKQLAFAVLAALATGPALAEPEAIQAPVYPPMLVPMPSGAYGPYGPYMMAPVPQMPAMTPYGMPVQTMPYMPYLPYTVQPLPQLMPGQPVVMPQPVPMPAPLPAPVAMPEPAAETTPVAEPAPTPAPVEVAAPAPEPAPAPAPVATPAPVAAPAPVAQPRPSAPPVAANPYLSNVAPSPFSALTAPASTAPRRPYEMRRTIEQTEKTQLIQMALPMMTNMMKMGMPDAMNYFARKYKAKPGLSFDDVRDSLFLRANQLNMKKVGENLMWMDFKAVLNDTKAPRIEVYSFCDIAVGRELLQLSPEFIVFLPCRIAVMEDADKAIWVLMLDWNLDWVAGYEQKLGLGDELLKGARDVNARMDEMMRAAANGDL